MRLSESENDFQVLDGCVLTGLENFLTMDLMKKATARKMSRLNAILDEQDRQIEGGCRDTDRLARISGHYSKWSTERAAKIGEMHAMT